MISVTLIVFLLASGDTRSIYGTDSMCRHYMDLHARHALYVDDVDLERQEPEAVMCQCVNVEMETWE